MTTYITVHPTTNVVTITLGNLAHSVYTITPDEYGLTVSVAYTAADGEEAKTQLGISCIDRVTAHVDAL